MIYSKILVAYDGSDLSLKALNKAVEFAKLNADVEIHVIHAMKFPDSLTAESYVNITESMEKAIIRESEKVLEDAEERLAELNNKTFFTLVEGRSAKEIVKYAEKHDCDLIVMGSRGLNDLKEFFLGSVSHNVVQHAHIPVLIVK